MYVFTYRGWNLADALAKARYFARAHLSWQAMHSTVAAIPRVFANGYALTFDSPETPIFSAILDPFTVFVFHRMLCFFGLIWEILVPSFHHFFFLVNFLFRCFAALASRRLLDFLDFAKHLHSSCIHFSLVTHIFTASSTALDRSPFFPPNLSITFNLSFFSSSSGMSTQIRPISITKLF